jgi:SAM-dependent methyltransferase
MASRRGEGGRQALPPRLLRTTRPERGWTLAEPPRERLPLTLARALRVAVHPGSHVLEVDCGDGARIGAFVARITPHSTGVDRSPRNVAAARLRGLRAHVHPAGRTLPFASGCFDVVLALRVSDGAERLPVRLGEWRRVLRPGGTLLLAVPNARYFRERLKASLRAGVRPDGEALPAYVRWLDVQVAGYDAATLRRLLRAAGFAVRAVVGYDAGTVTPLPVAGVQLAAMGRPVERRTLLAIARSRQEGEPARADLWSA